MTIQVHVVSLTINHDVMTHFQPKLVDNSGGSRVGTQIEKDVLLPNHKAIVARPLQRRQPIATEVSFER